MATNDRRPFGAVPEIGMRRGSGFERVAGRGRGAIATAPYHRATSPVAAGASPAVGEDHANEERRPT
jgi:hypothetical protein